MITASDLMYLLARYLYGKSVHLSNISYGMLLHKDGTQCTFTLGDVEHRLRVVVYDVETNDTEYTLDSEYYTNAASVLGFMFDLADMAEELEGE